MYRNVHVKSNRAGSLNAGGQRDGMLRDGHAFPRLMRDAASFPTLRQNGEPRSASIAKDPIGQRLKFARLLAVRGGSRRHTRHYEVIRLATGSQCVVATVIGQTGMVLP